MPNSLSTSLLNTSLAWHWIRQVAEMTAAGDFRGVIHEAQPGARRGDGHRLHVEADGTWHVDGGMDGRAIDGRTMDADAAQLLSIWLPWCLTPIDRGPAVIAQLGQSLDGRIATASGASHYVTGEASLVHLHRLRALVDAVIVGAGTVEADDPQLTVRHVEGRNPLRVVLDPRGRVSAERGVFTQPAAPTWHLVNRGVRGHDAREHVSVKALTPSECGIEPQEIIALLAKAGCRRILVEGGGLTISRFLQAGCLDRLHSVVAPMIIGSGRAAVTLAQIDTLDCALRPDCRHFSLGDDMLFDLDWRRAGAT